MEHAMRGLLALAILTIPGVAIAQASPKPLFASDAPIRITIQGPISAISRKAAKSVEPEAATLTLTSPSESHPIQLSARGLSRRTGGICSFPPLRVEFAQRPAATSLFAGQKRLKLVTHCKDQGSFEQQLLVEYAAYPMLNVLTPLSFKARLATVDYAEPSGKVSTTRWGFFLEDSEDVGKRNGLAEARVGARISTAQLEPNQAALAALFEYMIGNLDWSMRAGPAGEPCCHNAKLFSGSGPNLVPVIYDFDYSGMVDRPYAIPPEGIKVRSVRERAYRGYCRHNQQVLAAAADFRSKRAAIEAVFSQIPAMAERTKSKALAYLGTYFEEIATDASVRSNLLKDCLGG
jgi:hypothetical protein